MEIKFRGISLDTGKWVYGYAVFDSKKECANIVHKQGMNEVFARPVGATWWYLTESWWYKNVFNKSSIYIRSKNLPQRNLF